MGFWGTSLYENDCASDVRDEYNKFLQDGLTTEEAVQEIIRTNACRMGSDEEPLVWYALADTQWNVGELIPAVKERALWWIKRNGGLCFWEDDVKGENAWKTNLSKLANKLNSSQSSEKKINNSDTFVKNPWNVGDVYAYCFNTADSKKMGVYGKYILLQKIEDNDFFGDTLSLVRVFDKLFDEIPENIKIDNLRILPFSLPKSFMPSGKNVVTPKLALCAVLAMDKKRYYPKKHLTYICTEPITEKLYNRVTWGYLFDWGRIEQTLLFYYPLWQEYSYELLDNESVVIKKP